MQHRRRATPSRPARRTPANALSPGERGQALRLLNSPLFVDAAPAQTYAALLDQGAYVGSIATMYRLLRQNKQVHERRHWFDGGAHQGRGRAAAGPDG